MSTITFTKELTWIECGGCGVPFGLTPDFIDARRKDHKTWYCPNGCGRHYPGQTDQEKKIEHLEREVSSLASERKAMLREQDALTREQRDLARHVAASSYGPAQKGAFWRGHTAKECGECENACPYPTNRYGFRTAWFDGFGCEDPEEKTDG